MIHVLTIVPVGVLMCSRCKSQYGRGGWDKDKEGNDEFCRSVVMSQCIMINVSCDLYLTGGVLREVKSTCVTSVHTHFVTSA